MIQCVSDSNPYDDEPDPVEEAESWLKRHPKTGDPRKQCQLLYARCVIEELLRLIDEEL